MISTFFNKFDNTIVKYIPGIIKNILSTPFIIKFKSISGYAYPADTFSRNTCHKCKTGNISGYYGTCTNKSKATDFNPANYCCICSYGTSLFKKSFFEFITADYETSWIYNICENH